MFLNTDHLNIFSISKETLDAYDDHLYEFLNNWNSEKNNIKVQTSGSTGISKEITLSKKAVLNSAIETNRYFNLDSSNIFFICLPTKYIAGKMMIVRALVANAKMIIVKSSSNPIEFLEEKISFCAMTPHQLICSMELSKNKLDFIDKLIIGGSSLNTNIINQLEFLKTKCYQTFGMSETISHIALKQLNPVKSEYYECLPHINISTNKESQLIIDSALLDIKSMTTNDSVEIIDNKHFKWLGRIDNVINSGSIKLHPEKIEKKLESKLSPGSFFIDKLSHPKLGEQVILITSELLSDEEFNNAFSVLDSYEIPNSIYFIDDFEYTDNSKIHRNNTKNKAISSGKLKISDQ